MGRHRRADPRLRSNKKILYQQPLAPLRASLNVHPRHTRVRDWLLLLRKNILEHQRRERTQLPDL
jgi:hypothetical protein